MISLAGVVKTPKDAVRKILGGIISKTVQQMYSATGRPGPNGITKKRFNTTHVYQCMRGKLFNVIVIQR